jgi:ABC-type polar amino acid transport system ATPase subunit
MGFASAAADRVVFMDGGEIIEIDTPDNLFNTPSPRAPSNSSTTSSSDGKDAP